MFCLRHATVYSANTSLLVIRADILEEDICVSFL